MPHIAIVYSHFPHYRQAVFQELANSPHYRFSFFYDPRGVSDSIRSGELGAGHFGIKTIKFGVLLIQPRSCHLALLRQFDGFIFLGNPYILSTWLAAVLARLRGRPVFFWSHGWLRRETGLKAWLRRNFYRIADGLLVYGNRAREIGVSEGFSPERIHVINNSLDYTVQKQAREFALTAAANYALPNADLPRKPFFLAVTRLVPSVELDKAIEAMAKLPHDAALVVVGAGPERTALEARVRELGVDVRFLGAIYDELRLANLFLRARAVVSPGKVGLLAMHALAYGTPVITHDDPDRQMPEVEAIEPGVTGAFFKRGDVSDLARHMGMFLDRPTEGWEYEAGRVAAISKIEIGYTPQAQVALITAALDTKLGSPS